MKLPPEARAVLAGCLLESLDGPVDADAETAWKDEIDRRIRQLDDGSVKLVPWDQARRTIGG